MGYRNVILPPPPQNGNIKMLKVEIFKQETTVLLAATKLWLFYQKMPFSLLSSRSEQCHSNGYSPAIWSLLVALFILDYCSEGREPRFGLHPALSHFRIPARVVGEDAKLALLSPLRTNLAGCRKQVLAALLTH